MSSYYKVGEIYSIQRGKTKPAIHEGKIKIISKTIEYRSSTITINSNDADAEGGYSPEEFEALFKKMYPNWKARYAYTFTFIPAWSLEDEE